MTQNLYSYDTSYIIRVCLPNEKIFKLLISELSGDSNCIILRSVERELRGERGHLIKINGILSRFRSEIKKNSFETVIRSSHFMNFKIKYSPIAEIIEKLKDVGIIEEIISRIQLLDLVLEKGPIFPITDEDY